MTFEINRRIFEKKSPTTRFYGRLSSGSRVAPFGRTNGETDMAKIIVVFRNFAKTFIKTTARSWHKGVLNANFDAVAGKDNVTAASFKVLV